jgi:hypothetical protein
VDVSLVAVNLINVKAQEEVLSPHTFNALVKTNDAGVSFKPANESREVNAT